LGLEVSREDGEGRGEERGLADRQAGKRPGGTRYGGPTTRRDGLEREQVDPRRAGLARQAGHDRQGHQGVRQAICATRGRACIGVPTVSTIYSKLVVQRWLGSSSPSRLPACRLLASQDGGLFELIQQHLHSILPRVPGTRPVSSTRDRAGHDAQVYSPVTSRATRALWTALACRRRIVAQSMRSVLWRGGVPIGFELCLATSGTRRQGGVPGTLQEIERRWPRRRNRVHSRRVVGRLMELTRQQSASVVGAVRMAGQSEASRAWPKRNEEWGPHHSRQGKEMLLCTHFVVVELPSAQCLAG